MFLHKNQKRKIKIIWIQFKLLNRMKISNKLGFGSIWILNYISNSYYILDLAYI